jgi:murein DD-endopeptidase MepM/ murein hydrolase activator NlpD
LVLYYFLLSDDEVEMKKSAMILPANNSEITVPDVSFVLRTNKMLMMSLFFVIVVATGIFGFSLAGFPSESEYAAVAYSNGLVAVESKLSAQELLCLEIEKLDTKKKNDVLQEENREIEEATATIAETILGALMDNMNSKLLTNRSATVDNYISEAKNLITLERKLSTFKKTEDYDLIDLTSYESALNNRLSRIPTLKPIPGSFPGWGYRIHPIFGYRHFHPAADQGAPSGTPVKAAAAGYVVSASYDRLSGNFVVLNHGNGFTTAYLHNSANLVKPGQRVSKGEVIAKVGRTGTATGPHLHFEVRYNGTHVNPQRILLQQ